MASITKEPIGKLHDKLIVKVSKEDYYPSFEKAVKEYSKKVNMPGFRKGMVPAGMIKKMYGESIFYDEVLKSVEKQIQEYLEKEKPQIFAQPLPMESDMRNIDMANPSDYNFPFEIGLKPEIAINDLSNAKPTLYKVKVTKEMVDDEVEKLITKYGELKDAETITVPENVLNVTFQKCDKDGNLLPGSFVKDDSILLKYFSESMQAELKEKKQDDTIVLQLKNAFPEKEREWIFSDLGLNKEDAASGEKYFKMTITKIGLVEKRALNEEFFKQLFPAKELKTENDFRDALHEQLQQQWDAVSKGQLHDQLYHTLLDTPLTLPDDFLKRWIAVSGEKKKTSEEVEAEYPSFINQLKWTLISDKVIHDNKIEVSPDEVRKNMKEEMLQYFGQTNTSGEELQWMDSYIDRMMSDQKQVDNNYRKVLTDKLFNFLETQVSPGEKQSSPEELMAMQHHHHH